MSDRNPKFHIADMEKVLHVGPFRVTLRRVGEPFTPKGALDEAGETWRWSAEIGGRGLRGHGVEGAILDAKRHIDALLGKEADDAPEG